MFQEKSSSLKSPQSFLSENWINRANLTLVAPGDVIHVDDAGDGTIGVCIFECLYARRQRTGFESN